MDQPQTEAPKLASGPSATEAEALDIQTHKDIAALSYVWVLSVIVYLLKRDSPFVRYHAKQAIVLFILSIVVWFVPFIGWLFELVILALAVAGFIAAAEGKKKDMTIIGPLSRREITVREAWRQFTDLFVRMFHASKDVIVKHPETATKTQTPEDKPEPPSSPSIS